eukprot:3331026-Prymnesium_polylepis.1
MGIGEARMRCDFSIKTDGTFWIGYFKTIRKLKFGPNNRNEVALDFTPGFCGKKGICVRCLCINEGRVQGANEGHYCQCGTSGSSSGLSAAQKRSNQGAARERV